MNFALGRRDKATTEIFIEGLRDASRAGMFQISTDGFQPYITAIDDTFGERVDYRPDHQNMAITILEGQRRYSPPEVVDIIRKVIIGNPDQAKICTSHVERSNLTMRMHMRRLTRLTNAFSKKWENLWACPVPVLHLVQFRSDSQDSSGYARDAGRDHGSALGF